MQGAHSFSDNAQPKQNESMLLVVFVHGFKGDDQTFGDFPERLQHMLVESIANVAVECVVFPAYETKGNLNEAVIRFADWLTTLTVEREVASGGGAGKANIVLCGHSMGGLLIADTLLEFYNTRPDKTCPLSIRGQARLTNACNIQYLGIHPHVFKNSVTKAAEYASAAQTVGSAVFGAFAGLGAKKATTSNTQPTTPTASSSGWASWAAPAAYAVGGAVLAGAAAGSAYYKREDIGTGLNWATDHMKYVGNLWDEAALSRRIETLMTMKEKAGVTFHTAARMFIVLPKRASPEYTYFSPARNNKALDEIQAHTGMFGAKTNDGYYDLGLATAKIIRDSLPLLQPEAVSVQQPVEANPWNST
ncbi:hypothetical protein H0H87_007927 [Tephrocybe sp. NHM501043]|nr:hypothetical protein H0H87_007927 [Tephrocybe sp. NHM501043]